MEELEADGVSPYFMGDPSNNSPEKLYNPQVKSDIIPRIGQQFESLDEAYNFYNNYGKESGFGTRHHTTRKSKEGAILRKEFVCCKEGFRGKNKVESQPIQRKRGFSREGCGAKLDVVLDRSSGKFVVTQFVEGHSHTLSSPKRVHLHRSHRQLSLAQKALTQQLSAVNMPTCQQMSLFEVEAGGLENVGCTQRDLYNYQRDRRKTLEGQDAIMLHEHFQLEKEKNPGFTFTIEVDDEGRMSHCFWADATSRKSYNYFGDVVVFDTTYNTNRYSLIFAPILGVNHHGQTTVLGCGFLSDETSESFEWFFKEWLKAMPGGPPKMIITDQDPAMAKAIANTLPHTFHRLCIWHIVSKFSEKLGPLAYAENYPNLKKCIWDSESPEVFETSWKEVVDKGKLASHEWLNAMYKIRDRWIPAFTRHIFSAHMTSSQRAEISHAFFKRYVSRHNSLWDFITRFNRAMAKLRHNELELDHKDVNEKPVLKSILKMEATLSDIYTRAIFYKFQEELFQSGAYSVTTTGEDEVRCFYHVRRISESSSKGRQVEVEKSTNFVSCSCKMFLSDGIPCRHMLQYFNKRTDIVELPNEYILRRWTKSAKVGRVMDDLGSNGAREICDTPLLLERNGLLHTASKIVDEGLLSEEGKKFVRELFGMGLKKLAIINSSHEVGEGSRIHLSIPLESQSSLKEPLQVRAKGCGKRLKGGKEIAMKKTRRCAACAQTGHDKRKCPRLVNLSSQDVGMNDDIDDIFTTSIDYIGTERGKHGAEWELLTVFSLGVIGTVELGTVK